MRQAIAGAALALLASACASPSAPGGKLEVAGNRLFLPVTVNGIAVPGLLDSGAEMSLADDGLAARARLKLAGAQTAKGTGGTAEVRFAPDVDLAAAGIRLPGRTVAVLDLQDIVDRLLHRPVDIVLGRELFDAARLRIDIDKGSIVAVPPAREPRGVRIELETHRGIETLPASVEGHAAVRADFDLGNGGDVLVGRAYAEKIGLAAPGRIVGRATGGGLGGGVERDIVLLTSLTVGGRTFKNVRAAIDPTADAADLNLGVSILRHFVITTDFAQRALWLEPRS
jgi:hypothetical protein